VAASQGLKLLITKFNGPHQKRNTSILCVTLTAAPMAWGMECKPMSPKPAFRYPNAKLKAVHNQWTNRPRTLTDCVPSQPGWMRPLADTVNNQVRYETAGTQTRSLEGARPSLLTDANYLALLEDRTSKGHSAAWAELRQQLGMGWTVPPITC